MIFYEDSIPDESVLDKSRRIIKELDRWEHVAKPDFSQEIKDAKNTVDKIMQTALFHTYGNLKANEIEDKKKEAIVNDSKLNEKLRENIEYLGNLTDITSDLQTKIEVTKTAYDEIQTDLSKLRDEANTLNTQNTQLHKIHQLDLLQQFVNTTQNIISAVEVETQTAERNSALHLNYIGIVMSRRQDLSQIHFVSTNTGDESLQDEANARIKELENIKQDTKDKSVIPSIEAHKVAIQDYVNKCKENLNNIITKIAKEQENAQGLFAKIQREITKNFQKTSEEYTSAINGLKEDNQKLQDDLKEIKEKVITDNILKRADILLTHQEELNNQITERYSQLLAIPTPEANLMCPVVTSEEPTALAIPTPEANLMRIVEPSEWLKKVSLDVRTALAILTPEANLMCPVEPSKWLKKVNLEKQTALAIPTPEANLMRIVKPSEWLKKVSLDVQNLTQTEGKSETQDDVTSDAQNLTTKEGSLIDEPSSPNGGYIEAEYLG